jgi:transposase-like protein
LQTYTDEQRARVIAEYQTLGTSKVQLAKKYDVPLSTVRNWLRALTPVAVVTPEKREDIDALYTDFVADTLLALRQAARLGQDEDWLRSLPPREAYLWFGTLADKVMAALSAYQSAAERIAGGDPVDVHGAAVVG